MKVILKDGTEYKAPTAYMVLRMMKCDDWTNPQSMTDYKSRVQLRTANVEGESFLYWDSSSFLIGLELVGVIESIEWGV